jgi:hypothetical protein
MKDRPFGGKEGRGAADCVAKNRTSGGNFGSTVEVETIVIPRRFNAAAADVSQSDGARL